MFGLGLYIYAGEDLPQDENNATLEEATITLESYINNGVLQGDFLTRAKEHINNKNLDGIKKTIAWCQSQKIA
jgi:hypothetical protein